LCSRELTLARISSCDLLACGSCGPPENLVPVWYYYQSNDPPFSHMLHMLLYPQLVLTQLVLTRLVLTAVLTHLQELMLVTDGTGRVVHVTAALAAALGRSVAQVSRWAGTQACGAACIHVGSEGCWSLKTHGG
jgi:hypothetical protein